MEQKQKIIRTYFRKLGLEPRLADVYLCLFTGGAMSISELARRADMERTQIYRLLDDLKMAALIEVDTHYKRQVLRAAPIENLQLLVTKKEQELAELQADLPNLAAMLEGSALEREATHIQFYQGIDGVKQMLWNETRTNTDTLSILNATIQMNTDQKFFERWALRLNEQNVQHRSLVNDDFLQSQQQGVLRHITNQLENWQARYVSDSLLPIPHSTIIYDNVVAFFDWKDGQIFGIEIHNPAIAAVQRNLFEMLWQQASQIKS
ncbi:hypothetical protein EKI60_01575 [Candidatus Saccharibacteria bacterium]|nr:MAG: hypothetical protein EKI60_01575 [Candidatus Saccharibacteria bacterium]